MFWVGNLKWQWWKLLKSIAYSPFHFHMHVFIYNNCILLPTCKALETKAYEQKTLVWGMEWRQIYERNWDTVENPYIHPENYLTAQNIMQQKCMCVCVCCALKKTLTKTRQHVTIRLRNERKTKEVNRRAEKWRKKWNSAKANISSLVASLSISFTCILLISKGKQKKKHCE